MAALLGEKCGRGVSHLSVRDAKSRSGQLLEDSRPIGAEGERRLLEYVLVPMLRYRDESLREI
tara:strand:+ start:341 stop:529 length:189 start_codon:yes stop_codon:yes gene_type:complete